MRLIHNEPCDSISNSIPWRRTWCLPVICLGLERSMPEWWAQNTQGMLIDLMITIVYHAVPAKAHTGHITQWLLRQCVKTVTVLFTRQTFLNRQEIGKISIFCMQLLASSRLSFLSFVEMFVQKLEHGAQAFLSFSSFIILLYLFLFLLLDSQSSNPFRIQGIS